MKWKTQRRRKASGSSFSALLVMITTGIITSIHGAPSMAEYGFSLIFIYLLVAIVFLLPSALISAELATGWPEDGGVYVWVKTAFGERLAASGLSDVEVTSFVRPSWIPQLADAIGLDVNMLPVTPDRLVEALTDKRRAEKRQAAKSAKAAKAVIA